MLGRHIGLPIHPTPVPYPIVPFYKHFAYLELFGAVSVTQHDEVGVRACLCAVLACVADFGCVAPRFVSVFFIARTVSASLYNVTCFTTSVVF